MASFKGVPAGWHNLSLHTTQYRQCLLVGITTLISKGPQRKHPQGLPCLTEEILAQRIEFPTCKSLISNNTRSQFQETKASGSPAENVPVHEGHATFQLSPTLLTLRSLSFKWFLTFGLVSNVIHANSHFTPIHLDFNLASYSISVPPQLSSVKAWTRRSHRASDVQPNGQPNGPLRHCHPPSSLQGTAQPACDICDFAEAQKSPLAHASYKQPNIVSRSTSRRIT